LKRIDSNTQRILGI